MSRSPLSSVRFSLPAPSLAVCLVLVFHCIATADVVINELVAESSERLLRYHDDGAQSVGPSIPWWAASFDDSHWQTGAMPAGSGSNAATDLNDVLRNRTFSLYVRKTFTVDPSVASPATLTLDANFNDGIIVWLNGVEVARYNMGPPQGHFYADQEASRRGSSSTSSTETFDLGEFSDLLTAGENVIAAQVANQSISSTMWVDFSLTANGEEIIADGSDVRYLPGLTEPSGGLADFGALLDEDIEPGFSDWVELFNTGASAVDLAGWSLSDDAGIPNKWSFPENTTIAPGGFLVVMLDDLPKEVPTADYLHANFKLSAGGEYLGLYDASGNVRSELDPGFPRQDAFHSYGLSNSGEYVFFSMPSPGNANAGPEFTGRTDAPDFDHQGGFYDGPVTVTLTSETPGVTIRYTTDGTEPTETNGMDYTAPLELTQVADDEGHVIRARSFLDGHIASRIKTHTFLIEQNPLLRSAPSLVYSAHLERSLYDPYGVLAIDGGTYSGGNWVARDENDYNYAMLRGRSYERPIHAELYMPDGSVGFRTDCGVRLAASNWSRPRMQFRQTARSPWPSSAEEKPSFNIHFRDLYGDDEVSFPLNGIAAPVDTFSKLRVRAGKNDITAPFVTDEVVRRIHRDMGNAAATGVFNSLYVNGELKGYFNTVERLRTPFFGDHHGQTPGATWDVLSYSNGQNQNVAEGDKQAFNDLIELVEGTVSDANWEQVQQMADIASISDYYLTNIYTSMWDWPQNNWVAARERSDAGRYRFYIWDAEGGFGRGKSASSNIIDSDLDTGSGELRELWQGLRRWPQFRLAFADRIHKHFFNGGVLDDRDYENSHLKTIVDDVTAEFADLLQAVSRQRLNTSYISSTWTRSTSGRRSFLFGPRRENFARNDLWPDTTPPEFSQFGGSVPVGFGLRITNEIGTVYYTTNGDDPRLSSGDPHPEAGSLAGSKLPVTLLTAGSTWKADATGTNRDGESWQAVDYDDSSWSEGAAPLGYGSISGTTVTTELNTERHPTIYLRGTFEVPDASAVLSLNADVQVDSGCVVYLNGQELLRDGFDAGDEVGFDALPSTDGNEGEFDTFEVDPSLLVSGTNTLAAIVKNSSSSGGGSSDMVFDFALSGTQTNPENTGIPVDHPMTIKARAFNDGEWSALTEATFTVDTVPASSDNLAIAEFLYNPEGPTDAERIAGFTDGDQFEFLEVRNIGTRNVDLNGVRFTDGVAFDFSASDHLSIAPGNHIILVSDLAAFQTRYGNGFDSMIAGEFVGNLNNAGENVRLTGADDSTLHEFEYDDAAPWPEKGDDGYSLQIVDASGSHAEPGNWKTSAEPGGNPGPEDTTPTLTWSQWRNTFFTEGELQNSAFSGPDADADADLVSNFAEFVFGTSPVDTADRPSPPTGGTFEDETGTYLTITLITPAAERSVLITGETTADLTSWEDAPMEMLSQSPIADGELIETTYRELSPSSTGNDPLPATTILSAIDSITAQAHLFLPFNPLRQRPHRPLSSSLGPGCLAPFGGKECSIPASDHEKIVPWSARSTSSPRLWLP